PERDWSRTNKHLTKASREALGRACDAVAEPGKPLPTSREAGCADALYAIYDGKSGFEDDTTQTMHQPYAWGAQLHAGHTSDEMRAIAEQVYAENSSAPIGTKQTIGSHADVVAWVRIYSPMRDLVGALQANGFDVWVVS